MPPSLDDLLLLVTIADRGGFTAAARELALPKSTVSRRLADLEAQLGVALFHRSTRALSLTDEGRRIHDLARSAIQAAQDAARAVADRERMVAGRVTLTATAALGQHFLAPRMAALTDRFPGLQIELRLTEHRLNIIGEGIDIAVRMGDLDGSELVGRKLAKVRRVLVASPSYAEKHGLPQHPSEVANHRAIVTSSGLTSWRFADGSECALRWQIAAGNMVVALDLVRLGHGIALLPDFIVRRELAAGALLNVLAEHVDDEADAWLVCSQSRYRSPAVKAVFDVLIGPADMTVIGSNRPST